ncbi:MAG TPA: hypothetical protein VMW42_02220 [Desulfatiglandales bacterium]|nr:hypothetical protein [Desulfatiglandales bacterium]
MGKYSNVKRKKYEGDDFLSPFYLRLWSLVQEVLVRWNTLIVFKYDQYSVPEKKRGMIQFFVPEDCTFCYEIIAFLEKELEGEFAEGREVAETFFPGMDVEVSSVVYKFKDIPGHIDKEIVENMAKEFIQRMKLKKKEN